MRRGEQCLMQSWRGQTYETKDLAPPHLSAIKRRAMDQRAAAAQRQVDTGPPCLPPPASALQKHMEIRKYTFMQIHKYTFMQIHKYQLIV